LFFELFLCNIFAPKYVYVQFYISPDTFQNIIIPQLSTIAKSWLISSYSMIFVLGYRETPALMYLYSSMMLTEMLLFAKWEAYLFESKKEWTNNNQLLMFIIEIMVPSQLTYTHRI